MLKVNLCSKYVELCYCFHSLNLLVYTCNQAWDMCRGSHWPFLFHTLLYHCDEACLLVDALSSPTCNINRLKCDDLLIAHDDYELLSDMLVINECHNEGK